MEERERKTESKVDVQHQARLVLSFLFFSCLVLCVTLNLYRCLYLDSLFIV